MIDITKCNGEGCPVKDRCYRTRSKAKESFATPPCKIENGQFTCDMFWGDEAQQIFQGLIDIVEGKCVPD